MLADEHLRQNQGLAIAFLARLLSDRYVRERASLVKRLKGLSVEDWQRTAEHEAFSHYSVWIMFRHLLNHEMFHAYRIEELLLKKDWE
ncbi:MAG TPA: hypothetical protein VMZ30_12330 [Pyrinomonadaceae bacterium]|nr:hypothetical protein [Pyrinomonadaceae bacterium]